MMKKGSQQLKKLLKNYFNFIGFVLTLLSLSLLFSGCISDSYQRKVVKTSMHKKIESHYDKWKGTPYRYGGSSKAGIDCSALVKAFFEDKLHTKVPRTTTQLAKLGHPVSSLRAGDLVFFKTGQGASGLHVGIYYVDGLFLNATTSKGVTYSNLENNYWKKHYWMARRIAD